MKYSYKWLRELSGTGKSPEELADFLTMRAFEVEGAEQVGFALDQVVIGEVVELEQHSHAEKLRVAKVNVGQEILQIVCGAPNVAVGQKVPVALVGAKLPGDFEIQKRDVRGIESNGMICSQKELGLGEEHEGILVLTEDAPVGTLFKDFLSDGDWLLNIKVLPDRAHDCLSHVGMAREIVALEEGELQYDYSGLQLDETQSQEVSAKIEAKGKSARYISALMKGVTVKESPVWMRNCLKNLGVRPINMIVDVTNFVMLELGQPMHAFDWDAIAKQDGQGHIAVRFAQEGEKMTLLDEKEYALQSRDIVIADDEKALALAGVMGGLESSVKAETKNILFEAANFDPVTIRKTRTRLGLRTDASDRFEKGLDPNLPEKAMARALELLHDIAEYGEVRVIDVYPNTVKPQILELDPKRVERLLSIPVEEERMRDILSRLGCEAEKENEYLRVTVPTWRLDIQSAEDLIEEIGRGVGYDAVPALAPAVPLQGVGLDTARVLERQLKDVLVDNGFTEVYSYSFYGESDAEVARLAVAEHIRLANPMTADQALMRASLAVGLLKNTRENLKHDTSVQLFESGRTYFRDKAGEVKEVKKVAGVLVHGTREGETFFALKGLLQRVFGALSITIDFDTAQETEGVWHPTRTADIFSISASGEKLTIGRVGEIHPFVTERFKIKKRVASFELDFDTLLQALPQGKMFTPLRKYPEVLRDISLYVPQDVRVKDIVDGIQTAGGESVWRSELFDQYFDEQKNVKSLAFHIHFGAEDRTLEGRETDALLEKIASSLEQNLGAERRV